MSQINYHQTTQTRERTKNHLNIQQERERYRETLRERKREIQRDRVREREREMNLLSSPHPSILYTKNPKTIFTKTIKIQSLSFSTPSHLKKIQSLSNSTPSNLIKIQSFPLPLPSRTSTTPIYCTPSSSSNDPSNPPRPPRPSTPPKPPKPTTPPPKQNQPKNPIPIVDEWGEKTDPDPEPTTRFPDPIAEADEWSGIANGLPSDEVVIEGDERNLELKRALVDTVFGTDSGFGASSEVRAEALELVQQLEAANPTPKPTEATELLDGNWVLVYTSFSELLPLLAAGRIPTVKVEKICQRIDATNLTIENSTKLAGPVATFSFSALANFEVRSPCRIQVTFKEGSFSPPEIKSTVDLPENINIFGQNISLSPVQQSLNPLQDVLENVARTISSQSPLKIPIPGEQTSSWLLITYLDKDLRISRGDGGLFVLVKEGSPLLYQ
ncbi:hypothetical protein LIER_13386 [Lithospermum erythrorhizon]|uniref:Plastid lipid-associated protein/fibrillin conserved domain-containing protein n=1 Tax=Lithospermum erythrorhizon TaxID=34254 RepID=A0AAV3PZU0_LITER